MRRCGVVKLTKMSIFGALRAQGITLTAGFASWPVLGGSGMDRRGALFPAP